jgi:hypothetical protein
MKELPFRFPARDSWNSRTVQYLNPAVVTWCTPKSKTVDVTRISRSINCNSRRLQNPGSGNPETHAFFVRGFDQAHCSGACSPRDPDLSERLSRLRTERCCRLDRESELLAGGADPSSDADFAAGSTARSRFVAACGSLAASSCSRLIVVGVVLVRGGCEYARASAP